MTYAVVQAPAGSGKGMRFYGAARDFWAYKGQEAMLEGPYETGKTIAALTKLHVLLCKYPGCRALMTRKTYKSLVNSAIVTYERKVLPVLPDHPDSGIQKYGGERPEFYDYPNGSRIVCGGLDNPDRILSAEYDFIYVNQAEEISLNDWETILGRATGRAGNAPYTQVFGDCNPGPPTHWILHRKPLKRFHQMHEHNPTLFDQETGEITEQGKKSLAVLDSLTGIRYKRGRLGLWVANEGQVYEGFNPDIHVIDPFPIPDSWRKFRAIDFGYTNPFVCFDDQTEILTCDGWRSFEALPRDLEVATIDPETKAVMYQRPTAYIETWYEGDMITAEPSEQGANFSVTPNHRMVVANRKSGRWRLEPAARLNELQDSSIPTGWNATLEQDGEKKVYHKRRNSRGRVSEFRATRASFMRFLGLWLAEGCLSVQQVQSLGETRRYVRIAQKHDPEAVRNILRAIDVSWTENTSKNGVIDFRIQHAALFDFLDQRCGRVPSARKRIPQWVMSFGADSLRALLDGLMLGDGRHRTHNENGQRIATDQFFTTSQALADDVQSVACLLGIPSRITSHRRTTPFSDGEVEVFRVSFHVAKQALIGKLPIKKQPYRGYVRCVTVPNGMIVVRRGGRPMVCGNCQWWAVDEDGRLYLYREIYMTQRTVKVHADEIKRLTAGETLDNWQQYSVEYKDRLARQGERVEDTIADHDAEDRATLLENGIPTTAAVKDISRGIQAVQERLKIQGDGRPRLYIMRDALVEADPELYHEVPGDRAPVCTQQEFSEYVWPVGVDGKARREVPVDLNNHGMDAMRYLVMALEAPAARTIVKRGRAKFRN